MKIEVDAKILLTIPRPAEEETPEDFALKVEQHLNGLQQFVMPGSKTQIGIRVHIDGKSPRVT